jgi:hypothetical protein
VLCDLHLHTTKSDGVWPPDRLFEEIRQRDLQLFSITDHDCLDAYPVPADLQPRVIAGLEVDSHHAGRTVHILAYGIASHECELLQVLRAQRRNRVERMESMIARLRALDIPITMEDVREQIVGASSLGRPHLARALVAKGIVASVQEAFDRYIADEGDGFVALTRLSSQEIIAMVHRSGGTAVVAHPMRLHDPAHLHELYEFGVDGIEVIHPTADSDAERMLREFANERALFVTGGTDFHAPVADRKIGVDLDESDVARFQRALERRNAQRSTQIS